MSEPKETLDEAAAAIASGQFGLITRSQAFALGYSESAIQRRLKSKRWRVVLTGIYAIAGAPNSWHQQLKAATLAFRGVASHRAAAYLWQLPGFPRGAIEVTTISDRRPRATDLVLHCVPLLDECDTVELTGIAATTPARTLFDLAAETDPELLEQVLDHCLHQRLASLPRLRWTLQRLGARGRPGTGVMRELLEARPLGYVPTQSPLETRAARRILRALEAQGLPKPVRQYVVKDRGRFVAQVDFAYPNVKLAIEAQSVKHHAGRHAWARDNKRIAQLAAIGWRTMPVLWNDTESNLRTAIERIRRAIEEPRLFD